MRVASTRPVGRPTDRPTDRSTDRPTDRPIDHALPPAANENVISRFCVVLDVRPRVSAFFLFSSAHFMSQRFLHSRSVNALRFYVWVIMAEVMIVDSILIPLSLLCYKKSNKKYIECLKIFIRKSITACMKHELASIFVYIYIYIFCIEFLSCGVEFDIWCFQKYNPFQK